MKMQRNTRSARLLARRAAICTFLITGSVSTLLASPAPQRAATAAAQDETRDRPPNIVLIVADDLGWPDLACQGSRFYDSPHLDRLAREGLRLTNGYANAPNCAPTRACIMTGLYTPRHGVYTVGSSARGKSKFRKLVPTKNKTELDASFVTIPQLLKKRGYATGFFGKWHLSEDAGERGFDVNRGGCHMGHPKSYISPYRNPQLDDGPKGEYLTERMAQEACAFVRANASRPFYCQLSFYAVHTPIQPKPGTAQRFRDREPDRGQKNARYAGMISTMDAGIGRLMKTLDEEKLARETLVVFVSDNGGLGRVTSNAPLRGAKGMLYEGGIRVPWIVRMPGRVAEGAVDATPVITSDLLETFASFAGVPVDARPKSDGVDLSDLFARRAALAPRALFWHFPAYLQQSGRKGTWRTTPASAMRVGKYKLLHFFEDDRHELYDLAADPSERKDLAEELPEELPEQLAKLEKQLSAWRVRVDAPIPSERNPEYGK